MALIPECAIPSIWRQMRASYWIPGSPSRADFPVASTSLGGKNSLPPAT